MQISEQEISRLLAYTPVERGRIDVATLDASTAVVRTTDAAHVDISTSAKEVRRITELIKDLPDVRADRVQELKAQIENGTYHVSSEDIADLMIRRALADNTAI